MSNEPPQTPTAEATRDPKTGRILPGKTLNPGGDPKWLGEVRRRLQAGCVDAADYLVSVVRGEEKFLDVYGKEATEIELPVMPKDRIAAAKVIFEYTVPKPRQELEVSGSTGETSELRREVLARLVGLDS